MKKILFSLMLLLSATIGKAQDFVEVSNLEELKQAIDAAKDSNGKSTAKIKLTDNIYLNGIQNTLCTTFAGEIDGSYTLIDNKGNERIATHVIVGYKADEDRTRKTCSNLFTSLEGATIKNVSFFGIRTQSSNDNIGVIATQANSTTFQGLVVDSCSIYTSKDNAGAIVGQAEGCTFDNVIVRQCDVTVEGVKAGGFVGNSERNVFASCAVSAGSAVFADGTNWTNHGWSGGFVGYSKNDDFSYCINIALVGADQQHVGGFAGESDGSNFYQCQNSGFVANIDESDFREYQQKIDAYLKQEGSELEIAYTTGVLAGGAATLGFAKTLCLLFPARVWTWSLFDQVSVNSFQYFIYSADAIEGVGWGFSSTAGFATVVASVAAAAIITAVAVGIAVYVFLGDDEVGGICGTATGSFFEQCTNNASIKCKDDYCGGIVGLGMGVTINNCLNTGDMQYDENDTSASILGKAMPDNKGKKCLVTNCLSSVAFHMVGSESISSGMDLASGNNYRFEGHDSETCNWEMPVDALTMENGTVSYWLNNGVENRSAGIRPWRQTMYGKDKYPVLEASHDEFTVEDLIVDEILTPEDLIAFANSVNEDGAIFANAALQRDIDMTGKTWIPIGNSTNRFRGVFNGRGHTIKGLKVNMASDEVGAALFGVVHSNAIIRDVIIDNSCEFTNTKDGGAAGIVGLVNIGWYCGNVLIENCASYATINANKHAGGILGRVITTDEDGGPSVKVYVNNCYSMGTITATNGYSGLLCGYTKDHGHISNCWSAGSLKSSSSVTPYDAAHNEFFCGYEAKLDIKNCYAIGSDKNVQDLGMQATQNGVSRLSSEALNSGSLTYHLNGDQNDATKSLAWQQNLGTDTYPVFGSNGVFHTREINKEIGTVCLPFTLKSDDAISYYAFTGASTDGSNATSLNFEYVETVAPGQPVLFRVASTGDFNFSDPAGDSWSNAPIIPDNADWTLHGTFTERNYTLETTTSSKTIYYVSGGAIKNAKQVTINPYRTFFSGPSIDVLKNNPSGARVRIVIDGVEDETTALVFVTDDSLSTGEGWGEASYTLYGTKAGQGYRGVVIQGGKKVLR